MGETVTKENKEWVYRTIKNMLETEKLLIVIMFVLLTAYSALAINLPVWFLFVFMGGMFGIKF